MLGLSEAARLVGRDASTLHRAMKTGRLSYTVDAAGKRQLDPAELERVFGVRGTNAIRTSADNGADPERE
jgi:predicted site-specific integrase-resolvase